MFTKVQIEEWANAPEIQTLSGALKNAGLSADVDARKIREMRLAEKYGA
ncbi:MAG: hypothetical protein LBN37_05225 [Bacteroidales bacterium]|nr:hypothetical protein [Bacteroidales bacterium]